jgi:hypothetical protein
MRYIEQLEALVKAERSRRLAAEEEVQCLKQTNP